MDVSTKHLAIDEAAVYREIGVPTVINGRGATTAVGGSLMDPRVTDAMAAASRAYVDIVDLNMAVGVKIAEITGAEAGYVTCGSCAAMATAAAACIAGTDPEYIRRLPDSEGMANEIILHRSHRLDYDQMYRVAGGKIVEIGVPYKTEPWELERAITDRTAAVAYHDSPNTGPGALDFETVVTIAHEQEIPVIVDAASTLPPIDHLRRWIRRGADLVIYSGGKGVRGPQDSGMLAGRRDLIEAARLNGNPYPSVTRGMKVSKEAMVGLWVAIDVFMETDHVAELEQHVRQADLLRVGFASRVDCRVAVEDDWEEWPAPVVRILPMSGAWNPETIHTRLMQGDTPIHINHEHGGLMINTHSLQDGEAEIIRDRIGELIDEQVKMGGETNG